MVQVLVGHSSSKGMVEVVVVQSSPLHSFHLQSFGLQLVVHSDSVEYFPFLFFTHDQVEVSQRNGRQSVSQAWREE
jgi:hypothetical protein